MKQLLTGTIFLGLLVSCGSETKTQFLNNRAADNCNEATSLKEECTVGTGDAVVDPQKEKNAVADNKTAAESKVAEKKSNELVEADPKIEKAPAVLKLTTFNDNTKAIYKPCADACHSAKGSNRQQKPYLNIYAVAKAKVNNKRGGHKGIKIGDAEKKIVQDWVKDGLLEKQPLPEKVTQ